MSAPPQVWITRAEPGAAFTATRVAALGFRPLVAPLLTVRTLGTPIDLEGVGALAFTSMNGLAAFAARSHRRDLPVFTVGDATAEAARRLGFMEVASADGATPALVRLILSAAPSGIVLSPGPRSPAGDLIGPLTRGGVQARRVAIYETVDVERLPTDVSEALANRTVAGVLIHSPRAGSALAHLISGFDLSRTVALGLSAACLAAIAALGFADLVAAEAPREDALLGALPTALGNRAPRR